jgi:hypothetical protein
VLPPLFACSRFIHGGRSSAQPWSHPSSASSYQSLVLIGAAPLSGKLSPLYWGSCRRGFLGHRQIGPSICAVRSGHPVVGSALPISSLPPQPLPLHSYHRQQCPRLSRVALAVGRCCSAPFCGGRGASGHQWCDVPPLSKDGYS